MAVPYRTQAIVEYEKPLANIFTYYVVKKDGYSASYCPVCGKRFTNWVGDTSEGKACYPTKRVIVKGFWFWRKRCPLSGVHRHFKCRECDAISIKCTDTDEPKPELANFIER